MTEVEKEPEHTPVMGRLQNEESEFKVSVSYPHLVSKIQIKQRKLKDPVLNYTQKIGSRVKLIDV